MRWLAALFIVGCSSTNVPIVDRIYVFDVANKTCAEYKVTAGRTKVSFDFATDYTLDDCDRFIAVDPQTFLNLKNEIERRYREGDRCL